MSKHALEFEQPIAELRAKIEELRLVGNDTELNLTEIIAQLETQCTELTEDIFKNLKAWQIVQLARHPGRLHTSDYISGMFTDFQELHGDRHYSQGPSIIGGIGYLGAQPVMVLGHEKGRSTKERLHRNFGMGNPEDYRKALRLMKLAEKFNLPIITFIDTSGAFPGIEAEESNQSEAIARNLYEMSLLSTPILCTVIGEGGSGGALAIGVGDTVLMLEYSIYSVISPEGCASILWKDANKAIDASEIMALTAPKLLEFKLIDGVIKEPLGGVHRAPEIFMETFQKILIERLNTLLALDKNTLLKRRYERLMAYGRT